MLKTVTLLLFLSVCSFAQAQTRWNPEQQEVVAVIEGYLAAWNNSDAVKLMSFCDTDYDRIDARGNIYQGRESNLRHYTKVFSTPPDEGIERKLSYDIFSVRMLESNTAIVDARYTVSGVGPIPRRTIEGMNTVVLIKKQGQWLRVAHRQRIPFKLSDNENDG